MNITFEESDSHIKKVIFEGDLDYHASTEIRDKIGQFLADQPKKVMIDAGKHFLRKQERSTGISEEEIIHIAVKSMGLDELAIVEPVDKSSWNPPSRADSFLAKRASAAKPGLVGNQRQTVAVQSDAGTASDDLLGDGPKRSSPRHKQT